MPTKLTRLTDNDKNYGPLTIGKSVWNAWRLVYTAYQNEDYDNKVVNTITLHLGKFFIARLKLPPIVKPYQLKVYATSWDAATIERMGRNYYYEYFNKEYGVSYSDNFLQVFYGTQRDGSYHDQVPEKKSSWFLPWNEYRMVRHELYDANNILFWKDERLLNKKIDKSVIINHYQAKSNCSSIDFLIEDYDGEKVVLKTYLEIREWKRGDGLFKWMSWFRKGIFNRSLELDFTKEVGKSKGSWKGGMTGHSVELLDGETRLDAIKRYCEQTHRSKEGSYKLKYIRQLTDIESNELILKQKENKVKERIN